MADPLPGSAPAPTGSTEVTWLQPYPDTLLDGIPDDQAGPDVQVEQAEAVSLAFVTALQLLAPRARAVLILRDVLGFSARETADALDSTPEAVAMTLSRARAALRDHAPAGTAGSAVGAAGDGSASGSARSGTAAETVLVRRLTAALLAHDVEAVVALLAEDVRVSMPPLPAVWQGRVIAARFLTEVAFRLVPEARFVTTRANRQPALAVYTRDNADGVWRVSGLLVITPDGDRIAGLTRFESATLRPFGLPRILPDDDALD
jgi:RNA polymerase sigma-70 factor (ECF subfamily)